MGAYLEVWTSSLPEAVALDRDRLTLGKGEDNDVPLPDPTVSRLHATIERFSSGWCVTDLGSRNGTFVNGERILSGPRALRPGDEVRVGGSRIVFRDDGGGKASTTLATQAAPDLTRREVDILIALCRPVLSGDLLTEPASVRQMATELVLSEDAVKKHLRRLYEKFDIYERPARARLANEAIRRGAVTIGDLRPARDA